MLRTCLQNRSANVSVMSTRAWIRPIQLVTTTSRAAHSTPPWRPSSILDEWVGREARPISLRQLMVFGRSLTEQRLISSANYVRTELPTRLAHRIRDMQTLPYVVVTNPHISEVYELYHKAFENFRRLREVKTLEDNEILCKKISQNLQEHLSVIPKLAIGVLECRELMKAEDMDKFMNTILRSRISRRVIAEQHLALTENFSSLHLPSSNNLSSTANHHDSSPAVGEVLLKCSASDIISRCFSTLLSISRSSLPEGTTVKLPSISLSGHLDATFPYIPSHLEYIIGELLRNSIQAIVERQQCGDTLPKEWEKEPPPIEVTICEADQHVIIRVSDQGGGIPSDIEPHLWSFSKGPRSTQRIQNLASVPKMAATLQELKGVAGDLPAPAPYHVGVEGSYDTSLSSLSSRQPDLRLGMGLPLSRVFAEYWAGKLEVHSLGGYGVDAFLQISRLGNKNEQLSTRASIDAV